MTRETPITSSMRPASGPFGGRRARDVLARRWAPLVGRDAELTMLAEFVSAVPNGGSPLLLVGEIGIGKSRLLSETAELARTSGYLVLGLGGATEHDGSDLLRRLVRPLVGDLPSLNPTHRRALEMALDPAGRSAEPLVVYSAVLCLLLTASERSPVLLLVDDLPLLDPESAAILGFLVRRLGASRVGVLATMTNGVRPVDGPVEARLFARYPLARLDRCATRSLVGAVAPDLPTDVRERVVAQADGNPLAVLELCHAAREFTRTVGPALPGVLGTPPGPRRFGDVLNRLPPRTRKALLVLALDPRSDLRSLTGSALTIADLAVAEDAGLITLDSGWPGTLFTHPLVRSAIVGAAGAGELRLAHLSLAMRAADDVEVRAGHLADAATDPDESTAVLLEQAASLSLARGDSSAAAQSLAHAARLSPARSDRQRRLARAAFVGADSPVDSAGPMTEIRAPRGDESGALYVAAAEAFAQLDNGAGSDTACRTIRVAIQTGQHGWDAANRELLDAFNSWLLLCWIAGRDDQWTAFFDALGRLQPNVPEPLRTVSLAFADPASADRDDRDRLEQWLAQLDASAESDAVLQLATAAIALDLVAVARPAVLRLIRAARGGPATATYTRLLGIVALHDVNAGRWQQAEALVGEGLAAIGPTGSQPQRCIFLYVKSLVAGARGDYAEAEQRTSELDVIAARLDARGLWRFAQHSRVVAASARQDWNEVYSAASALSAPGTFATFVPHALWVAFDLIDAAQHTGRTAEARSHHHAMVAAGVPALSPRLAMLTAAAGAMLDESEGWADAFERALDMPQATDWPLDHARVQLSYGSRLRAEHRWPEARVHLHQAMVTFERLGATPWATRARAQLQSARGDASGPIALTAQERVIVDLAAKGLSNKEIGEHLFLSARTVSGHLYRVFPKLGVSSRSALRDALGAMQSSANETDAAAS